jgi:hypothetical protein
MTALTPGAGIRAAADRHPVTIHLDGRTLTGRLTWWPPPGRRTTGARARVQLPSGAYLSVPTDTITLAPTDGAA